MERFNLDIEKAVLGNCIGHKEVFMKVLEKGLTTDDFYNYNNQKVFDSLMECLSTKDSTDILLVCQIANKHEILPTYITNLVTESIQISDIAAHINELLNLKVVREHMKLATDIQEGLITTNEEIKKKT